MTALRGIGRLVAEEILLEFRKKWREAKPLSAASAKPFFAGYRGDDILIFTTGLDDTAAAALSDAGLRRLAAVAAAPAARVPPRNATPSTTSRSRNTRRREPFRRRANSIDPRRLDRLALSRSQACDEAAPRTLDGLKGAFAGQLGVTAKQLADESGITAAVYVPLGKARDFWAKHSLGFAPATLTLPCRGVPDRPAPPLTRS